MTPQERKEAEDAIYASCDGYDGMAQMVERLLGMLTDEQIAEIMPYEEPDLEDYEGTELVAVNDDLPPPWNVQRQANGRYAAFYGDGARRGGFATAQAAGDWAQENA